MTFPEWLVLCHPGDYAALWAYQGLRDRGLAPLRLTSPEVLACSIRSRHWLGREGVGFSLVLADGSEILSDSIRGVLNRAVFAPSLHLEGALPADRGYAAEEHGALFLSWLQALPGTVVNRPDPAGLSGALRHASQWTYLAGVAGLPTVPYRRTSKEPSVAQAVMPAGVVSVLVLGGQVFGPPIPPTLREACGRLATLADTRLLGVNLAPGAGRSWTFAGADTLPDLRVGGPAFLDALAGALRGEGRA